MTFLKPKNKYTIVTKNIILNNEKIKYTIRRHRKAIRLKIAISCDGNCTVTLPWRLGLWNADDFIRQNSKWILEKTEKIKKISNNNLLFQQNRKEYLKLKEYARDFVIKKIEKLNEVYKFEYKKIIIRNQKTRWGSCSSKGNLNFNYKIIFLPEECVNYIIVHELCHLREFNHSEKFWNLVMHNIPEYKKIKKQIKALQKAF
ncbi:MAG TPA: M48 family metallopeptidase [Candidatus Moranbacteria bacterium]|nr:M48 family metallopeptidase [Candidatus Moranbacteria bacterium]HRZ33398.1 M48 family metallopeptidase [Candidatus Moranbacteria bacterium]